MPDDRPIIVLFAGPNGAGKTTSATTLLKSALIGIPFVNADVIAQGLSGGDPDSVALEAGQIMLRRVRALADKNVSFAFETTLASKSFAPWIRDLRAQRGYELHLYYLWLPDAEAAIARVAERVRNGGHHIPSETVRRRYGRSLSNFFALYQPLADQWRFFDNSRIGSPVPIASGERTNVSLVHDANLWQAITEEYAP